MYKLTLPARALDACGHTCGKQHDLCDPHSGPMPRPERTDEANCDGCKKFAEAKTKFVAVADRNIGDRRQDAFTKFKTLPPPHDAFTRDPDSCYYETEEELLYRVWDRDHGVRHTLGIWQRPCRYDWPALHEAVEDADCAYHEINCQVEAIEKSARRLRSGSLPRAQQADVQVLNALAQGELAWMTEEEERDAHNKAR